MSQFLQKFFLVFLFFLAGTVCQAQSFPERPIKIVVYTKPGGAIDVFSRKFAAIAERLSGKTFIVLNHPGAGGVIALKKIQKSRPDGHTIGAVTKSNIGKMVSSKINFKAEDFNWLALLVRDPEALIVKKGVGLDSWNEVYQKSLKSDGGQKWVGPAKGGNDHITAQKIWKETGLKAKWVPYASGGKAVTALLGGHGAVYVGNPGDTLGKEGLKVIAVSSQSRLIEPFNNIPTFSEIGIKGLDSEIMWRGFLAPEQMPQEAKSFYKKLFKQVSEDSEWKQYIEKTGASSVFISGDQFLKNVKQDFAEFSETLKDFQSKKSKGAGPYLVPIIWGSVLFILFCLVLFLETKKKEKVLPSFFNSTLGYFTIGLFVYLFAMSFLGYFVGTLLFLMGYFVLLHKNFKKGILVSFCWVIFSYLLFYKALNVQLPVNFIFEHWGL